MSFKAEIIGQSWQGAVAKSLTARIGEGFSGGIYKACGLGNYMQYAPDGQNTFGFQGAWRTGIPFEERAVSRDFITSNVAAEVATVAKMRGFGSLDSLALASVSLPLEAQPEVAQKLRHDHNIAVGRVYRHSVACNGGVLGLTELGLNHSGERCALAAVEHLSPFLAHDPAMAGLFGDGIFTAALQPGQDLSVLATNTLFEYDVHQVLKIPLASNGALVPTQEQQNFDSKILHGTCELKGNEGHVFMHNGGIHQPLGNSEDVAFAQTNPQGLASMNGAALAKYFSRAPMHIMQKTLEALTPAQLVDLNEFGVIHQPSLQVYTLLERQLQKAQIANMPKHIWVAGQSNVILKHNNMSSATVGFALLNQVDMGQLTKPNVLFTGLGVGHNVTSTVFKFGD